MGARTRSSAAGPAAAPAPAPAPADDSDPEEQTQQQSEKEKQKQKQKKPFHLLILPKTLSAEARILLLPGPRDGKRTRFLFCPTTGLYEFTKVAAPRSDYRTLLLAPVDADADDDNGGGGGGEDGTNSNSNNNNDDDGNDNDMSKGYIQQDATFLVATPINLVFFLLPLLPSTLTTKNRESDSGKVMFQALDDILEARLAAADDDDDDDDDHHHHHHLRYLMEHGRPLVDAAVAQFCDSIEVGGRDERMVRVGGRDERMVRVSEDKVVQVLHASVTSAVAVGRLPASMEERFVARALEAPVLGLKRENDPGQRQQQEEVAAADGDGDGDGDDTKGAVAVVVDSQSTTTPPAAPTESQQSQSEPTLPLPPHIVQLMRLKVALDFILASYFSPEAGDRLRARILHPQTTTTATTTTTTKNKSSTPALFPDFTPLHDHLKHISALKAEAVASRSLGDFSRKRGRDGGDLDESEAAAASQERAEKKRKQEEDEKRKRAGQSRALRELNKVNVKGMKKMSDFFAKKPPPG